MCVCALPAWGIDHPVVEPKTHFRLHKIPGIITSHLYLRVCVLVPSAARNITRQGDPALGGGGGRAPSPGSPALASIRIDPHRSALASIRSLSPTPPPTASYSRSAAPLPHPGSLSPYFAQIPQVSCRWNNLPAQQVKPAKIERWKPRRYRSPQVSDRIPDPDVKKSGTW